MVPVVILRTMPAFYSDLRLLLRTNSLQRKYPSGPGRAELKLNRAGQALIIAASLCVGSGHKKVARFEP
jgi:hypothetical protein